MDGLWAMKSEDVGLLYSHRRITSIANNKQNEKNKINICFY